MIYVKIPIFENSKYMCNKKQLYNYIISNINI